MNTRTLTSALLLLLAILVGGTSHGLQLASGGNVGSLIDGQSGNGYGADIGKG